MIWSIPTWLKKSKLLSDTQVLMRLHAQPPLRMPQAIIDRARGILGNVRAVHRLQREALKGKTREILRLGTCLRINQLELMATAQHEVCTRFRADADPVQPLRSLDRAVGLD